MADKGDRPTPPAAPKNPFAADMEKSTRASMTEPLSGSRRRGDDELYRTVNRSYYDKFRSEPPRPDELSKREFSSIRDDIALPKETTKSPSRKPITAPRSLSGGRR